LLSSPAIKLHQDKKTRMSTEQLEYFVWIYLNTQVRHLFIYVANKYIRV